MKTTVTKKVEIVVCDECGRKMDVEDMMVFPMQIIGVDTAEALPGPTFDVQQRLILIGPAQLDPRRRDICHHCLIKAFNDALTALYRLPEDLH